jgi:hypothetical protein
MQKRIMSVLAAAITGAIIAAAVPARATSDLGSDLLHPDPLAFRESLQFREQDVPRTLLFKFASLYYRIMDSASRVAEFTRLDRATIRSLGIDVSFHSLDQTLESDQIDLPTTLELIPESEDESNEGFSLRINMSDDHAPLVDPSPRQPDEPLKDKIWVALGARYHHSDRLLLDVGYEHLWVNETTFDRQGGIGSDIMGDYRSEMDLIGARLQWSFD